MFAEGGMKSFKSISGMLNMAKVPNASSVVLFDNNFTTDQGGYDPEDRKLDLHLRRLILNKNYFVTN